MKGEGGGGGGGREGVEEQRLSFLYNRPQNIIVLNYLLFCIIAESTRLHDFQFWDILKYLKYIWKIILCILVGLPFPLFFFFPLMSHCRLSSTIAAKRGRERGGTRLSFFHLFVGWDGESLVSIQICRI